MKIKKFLVPGLSAIVALTAVGFTIFREPATLKYHIKTERKGECSDNYSVVRWELEHTDVVFLTKMLLQSKDRDLDPKLVSDLTSMIETSMFGATEGWGMVDLNGYMFKEELNIHIKTDLIKGTEKLMPGTLFDPLKLVQRPDPGRPWMETIKGRFRVTVNLYYRKGSIFGKDRLYTKTATFENGGLFNRMAMR